MKSLLAFSAGVVVGAVAVLSGVCAAALVWSSGQAPAERAGRAVGAARQRSGEARTTAASAPPSNEEQRIDEELAQTFPASDPLPYSHQIN